MKISRRTFWITSILGLLFLVGLLFPSFIQDNFVAPIALVLLLFWRILQSVDQAIYWVLLIFSALAYSFFRLYRSAQKSAAFEQTPPPDANAMLDELNYWRLAIRIACDETGKHSYTLEHNLGKVLAALYASKQPHIAQFEIYDALKLRQMPLPEDIYAFLFGTESSSSTRSVKQILHNLWNLPRKRIRRWTGREAAEYYQSLEQALKFMESVLENNHDDKPFDIHQH